MLTLSVRNRSKPKRTPTPKIDELLESVGLMRHVVPRDGNSLFRCISQCVFLTQSYYLMVRQHLLQFSILQTEEFSQITSLPASIYMKKVTDKKLDGDFLDMRIAAKVYKINIAFYVDGHPFIPMIIETENSVKTLNICLNYEKAFDLVFFKESVANVSCCQAIVYEMLYKNVFKLSGVDFAVKEMLFDRNFPSFRSNDQISLEKRATCMDMKELLEIGITPFPFKVAKALTPNLYRNTEYDIWLNNKKEKFCGKWNNWEFKEGSKCMVMIGNKDYHCYIQRIHGKNEPVEVYVKDLTQKICVEFDKLKLIPVEQDVREMLETPLQDGLVSSTEDDGNSFIGQVTEPFDPQVQYGNPDFNYSPEVHGVLPGQIFPPCFVNPYQQSPDIPLTSINSTINENVMHPWYMSRPPPILPNDFHRFKEQIFLLEEPPADTNFFSPSNFPSPSLIDTSTKVSGQHVQPMLSSSWSYNGLHSSTLCRCIHCNNGEESGVAVDSNQPQVFTRI